MKQTLQITSIKDDRIVFARSLQQRKGRIEARAFLIEGMQALEWALAHHLSIRYILSCEPFKGTAHSVIHAQKIPVYFCSEGILKKVTDTKYVIPVVAVAEAPEECEPADLRVVFDQVQDFGNRGTIVRTAVAFGCRDFVATTPEFDLYHRKTIDASRGTVFAARCTNYSSPADTARHLKQQGYQIVATALEGSTLQSLAELDSRPVALVFGNETCGVSEELLAQADLRIQIPMASDVDSLNVGVAAGISMYELKLKMVLLMLRDKIQQSTGRNLSSTARWLRRLFDHKLQELGTVTAPQAIILMILACDERGKPSSLVRMAGIDSSDTNIVFDDLLAQGLVVQEGEKDIAITEQGKDLLAKIWAVHERVETIAFRGFTGEERRQLDALLLRMQDNLEGEISYE